MPYKVLIVDDDTSASELFQNCLSRAGMEVITTNDSLKALDLLEKKQFDLLITDIRMPLISGMEIIRSGREFQPNLPVIIVASEATLSEAIEAINLNVFRFLEKPLKAIDELKDLAIEAVTRDTTNLELEHEELQAELDLLRKTLVDVYRLPRFGSIAAGIAHNMNSPLGGVIGYAQLAKMKNPDIKGIEMIDQQALRISKLLAGISEKGQSELNNSPADINLPALINKEIEYLNFNLYFKHQVEKVLKLRKIPRFQGVYHHFTQVLHQLIQNAEDAMYYAETKELTITTETREEAIVLKISDTGAGIEQENLDKIFKLGYTTKSLPSETSDPDEPQGYGVGLFIVKSILQQYNADIEFSSEVGVGTTVTITIPPATIARKLKKR